MSVPVGSTLRTAIRLITAAGVLIENDFFSTVGGLGVPSDSEVLSQHENWMEQIYTYLQGFMSATLAQGTHQVDVVELEGVYNPDPELNTSKVVTVANVGFITPGFNFTATGEAYSAIVTGAATANTAVPGVRGRKSFGGFSEAYLGANGVIVGTLLTALANATAEWLQGPPAGGSSTYAAGVLSHSLGEFAPFNGTGAVTNNPGTAVRRRIGRGS